MSWSLRKAGNDRAALKAACRASVGGIHTKVADTIDAAIDTMPEGTFVVVVSSGHTYIDGGSHTLEVRAIGVSDLFLQDIAAPANDAVAEQTS